MISIVSLKQRTLGFLFSDLLLAGLSTQTALAGTATLTYDLVGNTSSRT